MEIHKNYRIIFKSVTRYTLCTSVGSLCLDWIQDQEKKLPKKQELFSFSKLCGFCRVRQKKVTLLFSSSMTPQEEQNQTDIIIHIYSYYLFFSSQRSVWFVWLLTWHFELSIHKGSQWMQINLYPASHSNLNQSKFNAVSCLWTKA